ncbi:unnamed protein product [Cuscuta campestris]|uniref:Uncharacterized protein n=1 Tax=Cuscuta campestris TaxID=132261 RepID=A0A484M2C9_9ASTE|nr:unnamed protein product [Cuscuta campestris]
MFKGPLKKAMAVNAFIYVRPGMVYLLRKFTGHKELVRAGVTRFATAYLTLERMYKVKAGLRNLFNSEEWSKSKWCKEVDGVRVAKIIFNIRSIAKKRNRLAQKRLNDLVYVKYNRALQRRYNARDSIDPISLSDIDDSNEWLTGEMDGEENDLVFEGEDLTWTQVSEASGANEPSYVTRGNKAPVAQQFPQALIQAAAINLPLMDSTGGVATIVNGSLNPLPSRRIPIDKTTPAGVEN